MQKSVICINIWLYSKVWNPRVSFSFLHWQNHRKDFNLMFVRVASYSWTTFRSLPPWVNGVFSIFNQNGWNFVSRKFFSRCLDMLNFSSLSLQINAYNKLKFGSLLFLSSKCPVHTLSFPIMLSGRVRESVHYAFGAQK